MEIQNDKELLKENGRLRQEITTYQNALEAMEFRAKQAERVGKQLQKRLLKIAQAVQNSGEVGE